jgi:UDP-N-acetylglucosamine 2-epimerase (non-hydrolysing)
LAEGISAERIRLVGNIMIDSLYKHLEGARQSRIKDQLGLTEKNYAVLTLHRPSNVDEPVAFGRILEALERISERVPIVFPVHPRTRKTIAQHGLAERVSQIEALHLIDPLGYLDFLSLYSGAQLVLTDSGGIQEETSVLGIPCLTLRENTERPITVTMGTNRVVGTDTGKIVAAAFAALAETAKPAAIPLWDGHTAERILDALG